jgi:WD domain, G-beta repeat
MLDRFDTQQLEEDISRRYPYPLAATFHRAYYAAADDDESHDYLLDLFEVTLKYCASIALGQYFVDARNDLRINHSLQDLQRPSLGHWQGWLRDILSLYRREGWPMLVPELGEFYTHKDTGSLLQAYTTLRKLMVERLQYTGGHNLGVVTPRELFELLGAYRNRLAHGARPSRPDRERVAQTLSPAMLHLLGMMRPLADYPLVYVSDVRLAPGSTRRDPRHDHYYTNLTGDRHHKSRQPKHLDHIAADPQQLYLLAREEEFKPLLSLHPFFIFRHCENCNQEQAFVLNESKEHTLDYVSYQCTHHFSPAEYLDYVQDLLTGVAISASDRAMLVREEAESQAQEREEAERQARAERERLAREAEERRAQERAELEARDAATRQREEAQKQEDERRARLEAEQQARAEEEQRLAKIAAEERQATEEAERRRTAEIAAQSDSAATSAGSIATPEAPSARYDAPAPSSAYAPSTAPAEAQPTPDPESTQPITGMPSYPTGAQPVLAARKIATQPAIDTARPTSPSHKQRLRALWLGLASAGLLGAIILIAAAILSSQAADRARVANDAIQATATARMFEAIQATATAPAFRTLTDHSLGVWSIAFSPDGKLLASGSTDNTIRLWSVPDGQPVGSPLSGHSRTVLGVAFSPDGKLLASGSADNTIRLWSVPDGQPVGSPLSGHSDTVWSVAFSPDGKLLASGSADNTIRLWSIPDGQPVGRPLIGHSDFVVSVAFSPDGKLLASGSWDKTIRLWKIK